MQDEEFRALFHRLDLRLERVDTKVENLEKTVADVRAEFRTRFEGIDHRLNTKAGNWVVTFWGSTLAILIGAAFALTRWCKEAATIWRHRRNGNNRRWPQAFG
jgi:hypothetical protein